MFSMGLVDLGLNGAVCDGGVLRCQGVSVFASRLARSPLLATLISAGWATDLPGYGRLLAILAEARVFHRESVLSSACTTSFLFGDSYAQLDAV